MNSKIRFQKNSIPVTYKGFVLKNPMRLNLLVGGKVIIEVKATEQEHSVHKAQVLTYLRLTKLKLGLLLNFGQKFLCDGIDRVEGIAKLHLESN